MVDAYIQHEVSLGRVTPLCREVTPPLVELISSPIGVIPKRNRQNKWRLIVDLSSPKGSSVNDGIHANLCSLTYASVEDAAGMLRTLGKGALLAKLDLKDAYRTVPVHPQDRPLLGMRWKGETFIDCTLPFGLRSAPKIFSALADGLMWIVHSQGFPLSLHYLDDFLLLGPANSPLCQHALSATLQICSNLGFPVADEKTEGPTTSLTFLGIEIDSQQQHLRLPQEKLSTLLLLLNKWMPRQNSSQCHPPTRRTIIKRDLLSLIGLLNHAASVVRPGRTFLRSLIDASMTVERLDHHITLSAQARADIVWWHTFVREWNGISIIAPTEPTHFIYSDASGSWGCGAYWLNHWFQIEWESSWASMHIAAKELVPIVVAAAIWGRHWRGSRIRCYCDNSAVVFAINKRSAQDPQLMRLLRSLFFFSAAHNFTMSARHIAGSCNSLADALSRNNAPLFYSLQPTAQVEPSPIPQELLKLVLNRSLHWTSPNWTKLFVATWGTVLHHPHAHPTLQPNAAMPPSASKQLY